MTPNVGYIETLQALKDHPHFNTPIAEKTDGKNGHIKRDAARQRFWSNNTGPASALAVVNSDGSVSLTEGSPDIGGSRAAVSQPSPKCWAFRWRT